MHPLAPDLREMKDEELRKKFTELQSRLTQAYRFGNNNMVMQIQMLMEDYSNELGARQQKQLEEMMAKNGKFKDLIDIK